MYLNSQKVKDRLNITNRTIVFTGGGTGGHIWPLVSIMMYARDKLGVRPVYFGPIGSLEQKAIIDNGFDAVKIPSGKRRNYRSIKNLFDYIKLGYGLVKAYIWLSFVRPALVFGKGGFGMLPTVMAAKRIGIRVVSHDSDIVIGRSSVFVLDQNNILLSAFPVNQYEFTSNQIPFVRYVGMPIHPGFYKQLSGSDKYRQMPKTLGESELEKINGKYILVFGGSQGAVRLNRAVMQAWSGLVQYGHIIHITGQTDYSFIKQQWAALNPELKGKIHILSDTDNLPAIIGRANVAISRAGSTSLWELISAQVPTIAVPLPEAASDHQRLNALWLSQEFPGFIQTLEEKQMSTNRLVSMVKHIVTKPKIKLIRDQLLMPESALENIGEILSDGLTENYFKVKRNFHIIGIKGVSMSGIARVLRLNHHIVSGSDLNLAGHNPENIKNNIDAVVCTSAALSPNAQGKVEIDAAKSKSIPVVKRSQFISDLVNLKTIVAISGMHGKSTTSSMLAHILKKAKLKPSYFIGVPEDTSNRLIGSAEYNREGNIAVIEACEYDRSFYDFHADTIIVTNIEPEHLDYFSGGLPEIERTFSDFIKLARPAARLILPKAPNSSLRRVIGVIEKERPDISMTLIDAPKNSAGNKYHFFGQHIMLDAALAVEAAQQLNIKESDAWSYLEEFPGAKRRMEYIGQVGKAMIFDDYGHHPTEIAAVIKSFRERFPGRRLVLVFQPHQYSRTKILFKDFVSTLAMADQLIITDIYEVAGREQTKEITSTDIVSAINSKYGKNRAIYLPLPYTGITQKVREIVSDRDIIITMGATDIYQVAEDLKQ